MNFIFISPQFPSNYWQFCSALRKNGINVLGISDAPYESLDPRLKEALTEYYKVDDMEDYDQMYRAVAFLAFRHGRIDWIESNNEYWLGQDARLRTDFNVATGIGAHRIAEFKEKSKMKEAYAKGGIPTPRQIRGADGCEKALEFASATGYPLIAKPDVGVGANDTHKIHSADELRAFFASHPAEMYVLEEFISGQICSYDAVIDSRGEPVFESMAVWPPSIMDIVNKKLELCYYVDKSVDPALRDLGRRTVKAFGAASRFVHLEFFRLDKPHPGLGDKGDFVALEVNMRPAGGYTPDMMNYAHSTNVHQIWADMVAFDENRTQEGEDHYCVYASRRDIYDYAASDEEIRRKHHGNVMLYGRVPQVLAPAMGDVQFTARFDSLADAEKFIADVTAKR